MELTFTKWDAIMVGIVVTHVFMCPYTKVEESFNIQAIHDFMYHQSHLHKYDHFEFPGVVPRTFLGAFVVSLLSFPFILVLDFLGLSQMYGLYVVRCVLGCLLLLTTFLLKTQIRKIFGPQVSKAFLFATATQFHFLYYLSRPLPNVFALSLVNLAFASWLNGQHIITLQFLVSAAVIFRCDTVLLLVPIGLSFLMTGKVDLWRAIKHCLITALLSIGLTVLVDSFMWQRWVWPEMEVFWFNTVLNRSSEWGVSPVHWYFTSALPRALLGSYPLCFVGLLLDRRIAQYLLPVFAFILLYSKLPHKELRFIFFALPMLNMSAAVTIARMYNNRHKRLWMLGFVGCIGLLLVSSACTIIMSTVSYQNYPGGKAMSILHQEDKLDKDLPHSVHIGVLPAMTGVSRFSQNPPPWTYSKEEDLSEEEFRTRNYTYLLSMHQSIAGFNCLRAVEGFSRLEFKVSLPPIRLVLEPKVFIHGNNQSALSQSHWQGCKAS